ncbi:hypothetical protein BDR05DRAFT_978872 [Suillus weaverae]|nr:hypothetical protein BDR05DRAFT_978872 [Suillus weaverae]
MLLDEDEAELSFNDDERARVLAAAIIAGSEVSRQERIDTWRPHRLYLCRPQLLPNPRINTPWQVLYDSQNDRAFITMMGVDVSTFSSLLTTGFAQAWHETPIPRDDVSTHGNPRTNQCSLDAAGVLGLVLHYLSSTMHAISLQQIFAIIPSTVTRYLNFDAKIQWPGGLDFERCSTLVVARHGRLGGAFGSIDGLKLSFSAEGVIIAARLNALGSWHGSCYYVVADTAFPRGSNDIQGRIRAPLKQGQRVQGSLAEIDEHMAFNRELLSYRQTAEWGMRGLQGAFGRLRVPLEIGNKDSQGDLIEICIRLHNLRAIRVGINQIRTTDDDIAVWSDFENMLFSEQRQKD